MGKVMIPLAYWRIFLLYSFSSSSCWSFLLLLLLFGKGLIVVQFDVSVHLTATFHDFHTDGACHGGRLSRGYHHAAKNIMIVISTAIHHKGFERAFGRVHNQNLIAIASSIRDTSKSCHFDLGQVSGVGVIFHCRPPNRQEFFAGYSPSKQGARTTAVTRRPATEARSAVKAVAGSSENNFAKAWTTINEATTPARHLGIHDGWAAANAWNAIAAHSGPCRRLIKVLDRSTIADAPFCCAAETGKVGNVVFQPIFKNSRIKALFGRLRDQTLTADHGAGSAGSKVFELQLSVELWIGSWCHVLRHAKHLIIGAGGHDVDTCFAWDDGRWCYILLLAILFLVRLGQLVTGVVGRFHSLVAHRQHDAWLYDAWMPGYSSELYGVVVGSALPRLLWVGPPSWLLNSTLWSTL
mmetsp:Transcript_21651/g.60104  ORF Transcript_21651/g.60104 Transcript_21651/m.60104 type:complete len:409 (+) Transcript_21651:1-1227(+)